MFEALIWYQNLKLTTRSYKKILVWIKSDIEITLDVSHFTRIPQRNIFKYEFSILKLLTHFNENEAVKLS